MTEHCPHYPNTLKKDCGVCKEFELIGSAPEVSLEGFLGRLLDNVIELKQEVDDVLFFFEEMKMPANKRSLRPFQEIKELKEQFDGFKAYLSSSLLGINKFLDTRKVDKQGIKYTIK